MGTVTYLFHTMITFGDGELGGCSVCGAWEGEMPTNCPGHKIDEDTKREILEGRMDYRRSSGGWTEQSHYSYIRTKMKCLPSDD